MPYKPVTDSGPCASPLTRLPRAFRILYRHVTIWKALGRAPSGMCVGYHRGCIQVSLYSAYSAISRIQLLYSFRNLNFPVIPDGDEPPATRVICLSRDSDVPYHPRGLLAVAHPPVNFDSGSYLTRQINEVQVSGCCRRSVHTAISLGRDRTIQIVALTLSRFHPVTIPS